MSFWKKNVFLVQFKNKKIVLSADDTLAEWLRRRPAKPLGFARESSNLSGVVFGFLCFFDCFFTNLKKKKHDNHSRACGAMVSASDSRPEGWGFKSLQAQGRASGLGV